MQPPARIFGTLDPFVEGGPTLGRKVANATFLRALLCHDPCDAYHFFLNGREEIEFLGAWLRDSFPALAERGALWVGERTMLQEALARTRYHCFHLSDGIGRFVPLAQLRNAVAAHIFPITGVTHSLSYTRFMPEYLRHLWPGASARDAIIVTSESVRLVMERIFSGLRQEYGLAEAEFPAPRLEKIPLAVDPATLPAFSERWDQSAGDAARRMRERLGLALEAREVLFLCLGRICPYSKMDLMPLFPAFKRAEAMGLSRKDSALVISGWADEKEGLPEALCGYAKAMGIRLIPFVNPTDEERRTLYAAADVFVSPSDNIQESFGLAVAEAGGASLPVIASDFDGYRDIVVHGESGLLVPSLGFAATPETEVQAMLWFDKQYHLKLAQSCAIDVPALAEALARLGGDAALRARMGAAGRKRVLEQFSWDRVITRYTALWDSLAGTEIQEEKPRAARHPQRMRFGEYFRGHFTRVLDEGTLRGVSLRRTEAGEALYRGALPIARYAGMELLLDQEAVRRMLLAARKPVAATELTRSLREFFEQRGPQSFAEERAAFSLLWALKQDYLEICP